MKNKLKKITTILCLLIIGVSCITGCSATGDITLPTDYDVTTNGDITLPTDYNVTTTITEKTQYRLTVINDSENGTIFPNLNNETSSVMVDEGDSYTFTIKAKEGYEVQNLLIDGELVDAQEIYTFSDINENHSIGAVYLEKPKEIKSLSLVNLIYSTQAHYNQDIDYSLEIIQNKSVADGSNVLPIEGDETILYESGHKVATSTNTSSGYIEINQEDVIDVIVDSSGSFRISVNYSNFTWSINDLTYIGNDFYNVYVLDFGLSTYSTLELNSNGAHLTNLKLYFIANY